jgi:GT2 family glycosyltransferase
METLAPPVVAVIVTCDPGAWFDETLAAFAAQDYPELSVLVLDAASAEDPTPRVAAGLPGAYVRRLERNDGFGASANQVLGMVEGASHFLFCHDDVAPDADAVHLLMEEAFRSNAGVVAPKLVSWEDPARLLHVGMAVDKSGAVVDRVEPGELDAGQHDAVRDVFLAPGGCTLVRADLFAELGGFAPEIFVMGEDLDLCWRAQVAGARVVVAPAARVRHLEQLASGRRAVPAHVLAEIGPRASDTTAQTTPATAGTPDGRRRRLHGPGRRGRRRTSRVTLQSLQRRHELHAVMTCYGRFHRARVLPQVAILAVAEWTVAVLTRHGDRAFALVHAWRWNLARRKTIGGERRAIAATRRFDDAEVRRLQLHGSARLTAYLRRALAEGLAAAHVGGEAEAARQLGEVPVEPAATAPRARVPLSAVAWTVIVLFLLFGSRGLLGSGFPWVGQLLSMPSVGTLLHRFAAGWQPAGVGTTDPTSPATALLGVAGIATFGAMGLLQKVVVLGCLPVGALGMARLLTPMGSRRARAGAAAAYLVMPIAYNALAVGQWAGLVAFAAAPWILLRLCRASGLAPYAVPVPGPAAGQARGERRRRRSLLHQSLALGLLLAVVVGLAPSCTLLAPVLAAGLLLGVLVSGAGSGESGAGRGVARMLGVLAGGAAVAAVLLTPWFAVVVASPDRWQVLAGTGLVPATAPGFGQLLEFAVGPIGHTPLVLGFLVAGALPLWIGARWRLAWAVRAWLVVAVAMAAAWAAGQGWLGPLDVPAPILLAAAATGLSLAIGLGVVAFETDLRGHRFGWRQGGAAVAALAVVAGALPALAASVDGRWHLPQTGYGQATAWMTAPAVLRQGDFRVLWLGDPRALPGTGWSVADGLSFTMAADGPPGTPGLWPSASPQAAAAVGDAVHAAMSGGTVTLGALLAPYAVRYIVLVDSIAPSIPGLQAPIAYPPPASVGPGLAAQIDLRHAPGEGGFDVYVVDESLPLRAAHRGVPPTATTGTAGWVPVLRGQPDATAVSGTVPAGTVLAAVAPGAQWRLSTASGRVVDPRAAFGYAAAFEVRTRGTATVRFRGSVLHGLAALAEVVFWLIVAAVLLGRRRWLDWWWGPLRRRRVRGAGVDAGAEPSPAAVAASSAPTEP